MSAVVQLEQANITVGRGEAVHCTGPWTLPHLQDVERALASLSWPRLRGLIFDASHMTAMDTGGAVLSAD